MKITLLRARELTPEMSRLMEEWRTERPAELGSPFLSVTFLRAVAAVRDDAWIAWIERDGVAAGGFAFHRRPGRVGRPLGLHLSDCQGIVAPRARPIEPAAFLAGCGLELFDFDHLLTGHLGVTTGTLVAHASPIIETAAGYDALTPRWREQSTSWTKVQQCRRRLERESGALRFEFDVKDPAVWSRLLTWKRGQYAATAVTDVLRESWVLELLERLRDGDSDGRVGVCSALWSGDRLIAAHFGMRSLGVMHYWFPAYDPEFARHGPGLLLLDEIARHSAQAGDRYIDLGVGDHAYKRAWATSSIPILSGTVTRGGVVTAWRQSCATLRRLAKDSPVAPWLRRLRGGE